MFGVWDYEEASQLTYFGLHALQHRGQNGTGMTVHTGEGLRHYRGLGLLSEVFQEELLNQLSGQAAIGQVHYSIGGESEDVAEVGPHYFHFYDQEISVAHSGCLINSKQLRQELESQGAVFHSESDSELLVHLIRRSSATEFDGQLSEALNRLEGGFSFIILTKDGLYAAVDPNCFRPLSYGHLNDGGSVVVASETCAFHTIGASIIDNVRAGTFVKVDNQGIDVVAYTDDATVQIEAMEYVYFARPDSEVAGVNIHTARKNSGRRLALEQPTPGADMVIGVPNSSLSAATGYAEESGLPYEMGLVKNAYVARTFIQPTQALRELGVRKKLSAVQGVVKGHSIVLVDDSIVRGTTSCHLIKLLRDAGAREIHLRIASPAIRFPNYYGVDMSTSSELLAANLTHEEMVEHIGCDSLGFISPEGLIKSIGTTFDAPHKGLSMSIFTGEYPAGLGENRASFLENLTDLQRSYLEEEGINV